MPPGTIEIEAIAHDELVGDLEADEVGLDRDLGPALLPQQHQRPHARRPAPAELPQEGLERVPGVEDVIHEEHVLVGQVGEEVEPQFKLTRPGGRAPVTARPDHAHLHRSFQPPDQVGDHHDAAGKHPHDDQRPTADGFANLRREPVDPGGEFV